MPCFSLHFDCSDDQAKMFELLHHKDKETFSQFLALCLQVGIGHFEEEGLKFLRDRQYDQSVPVPDRYARFIASKTIAPIAAPKVANELLRRKA